MQPFLHLKSEKKIHHVKATQCWRRRLDWAFGPSSPGPCFLKNLQEKHVLQCWGRHSALSYIFVKPADLIATKAKRKAKRHVLGM